MPSPKPLNNELLLAPAACPRYNGTPGGRPGQTVQMKNEREVMSGQRKHMDDPSPKRRLVSVPEAAEYLGRSTGAVREMIYSGKLPCVRFDRRVSIDLRDLENLIEHSKVTY